MAKSCKAKRKAAHRAAIMKRLERAALDLHHNATPSYPDFANEYEAELFESWFSDAARYEIDYIQHGGASGGLTRVEVEKQKRHEGRSIEYASRYAAKWARGLKEDRAKHPWERVSELGTLYQYGRGGCTLAPAGLIKSRGGSAFSINADFNDNASIGYIVDVIRILESFNAYVGAWCEGIPDMWKEEKAENGYDEDIAAHG